jgi:cation transport ATPase
LYAAGVGAAAAETQGSWRIGLEAFVFVAAFLFAGFPLFGKGAPEDKKYRRIQIAIAMVAFLAWAYALNTGIVAEFHLYHTTIALVVLFVVTTVAGRYEPRKPANGVEPPKAAVEVPPVPVVQKGN